MVYINFGQIFHFSETHPNVSRGSEEYSAKGFGKRSCIILDSQWFLVSAENQLRPLYYSTWYIFNFGQIFHFSETHPNVSRGSEEYSAKGSAKDLALY